MTGNHQLGRKVSLKKKKVQIGKKKKKSFFGYKLTYALVESIPGMLAQRTKNFPPDAPAVSETHKNRNWSICAGFQMYRSIMAADPGANVCHVFSS